MVRTTPPSSHPKHKARLHSVLRAEAETKAASARRSVLHTIRSPRVLHLSAVAFLFMIGLYATGFWMPQSIKAVGHGLDHASIGLLVMIPNAIGLCVMVAGIREFDPSVRTPLACRTVTDHCRRGDFISSARQGPFRLVSLCGPSRRRGCTDSSARSGRCRDNSSRDVRRRRPWHRSARSATSAGSSASRPSARLSPEPGIWREAFGWPPSLCSSAARFSWRNGIATPYGLRRSRSTSSARADRSCQLISDQRFPWTPPLQ